MSDAPERIWAYAGVFKMWRDHKTDRDHVQTEYVRADLCEPMQDDRVKALVEAGKAMAKSINGNYYLPGAATAWDAALASLDNPARKC
jgi:hypothetical protein